MRDIAGMRAAVVVLVVSAVAASGCGARKGPAAPPAPRGEGAGGAAADASSEAQPQDEPRAAGGSHEEGVKTAVDHLFAACVAGDCRGAAEHVVYRGDDAARKWKDTYDCGAEEEKREVLELCAELNEAMAGGGRYVFGAYQEEEESEGVWRVIEVTLIPASGKSETAAFAFLLIGGRYALGDVD